MMVRVLWARRGTEEGLTPFEVEGRGEGGEV